MLTEATGPIIETVWVRQAITLPGRRPARHVSPIHNRHGGRQRRLPPRNAILDERTCVLLHRSHRQ
jgi:hypothetical protein